mmetsp:Transcript_31027/g.80814  ORF Transcript_31027/g.80814 Transcript_31027/m.80814 type:complete len:884 (+) Transcript_31027:49-2700(+)
MIRFAPLQSCVDASFWSELGEHKLHALRLSEAPVEIHGWIGPSRYSEVPSQLQLDSESFAASVSSSGSQQESLSSSSPCSTAAPEDQKQALAAGCEHSQARAGLHKVPGTLLNTNTLQGFKTLDRQLILRQAATQVWCDILSGAAEQDPARLCRFWLTAHGDLKHFHFHYWFAFPALKPPVPFTSAAEALPLSKALSTDAAEKVCAACDAWRGLPSQCENPYSSTAPTPNPSSISNPTPMTTHPPRPGPSSLDPSPTSPITPSIPAPFWLLYSASGDWQDTQALPLSHWPLLTQRDSTPPSCRSPPASATAQQASASTSCTGAGSCDAPNLHEGQVPAAGSGGSSLPAKGTVMLAFSDPCNLPGFPGWPLRNALLMVAVRWGLLSVQVLCVRDRRGRTNADHSPLLHVDLPPVPKGWCGCDAVPGPDSAVPGQDIPVPEAVGWEANKAGKLAPRMVDLGPLLSSHQLAEQAVDLNLMLMRWRAAPTLNVEVMSRSKCLLLGAGTLGCAVARTLLAWGVRDITFVDSSRVSFSNPVRQSLYEFEDCEGGGKPKAEAAAQALKRIFPSARSQGHALSIPMPGHPPLDAASQEIMQKDMAALDRLITQHDAVFLLTDTRESRWLPSLLAAAHGKIAITSAIGFDSFLVMRHGAPPSSDATQQGPRLGCYFCNDVVAPVNSTKDRALDQQCTVARPGLAPIAGALCVELLAALLQHPQQVAVKPLGGSLEWEANEHTQPRHVHGNLHQPQQQKQQQQQQQQQQGRDLQGEGSDEAALGGVPHMLRGNLTGFNLTCMEGRAFSQCTACSSTVVRQFRQQGWELVLRATQEPAYLEELTGLAALQQAMQQYEASLEDCAADGEAKEKEGGVERDAEAEGSESGDEWTSL